MFTVKYKFQGFQWFSFESLSTHSSYCVTESLYMFPCQWNYRPDHCIYGSNCQQAEQEGVFILHGNRGVYHDDKQPAFQAVYEAIQKVRASSQKSTLPYKGNKYSCPSFLRKTLFSEVYETQHARKSAKDADWESKLYTKVAKKCCYKEQLHLLSVFQWFTVCKYPSKLCQEM